MNLTKRVHIFRTVLLRIIKDPFILLEALYYAELDTFFQVSYNAGVEASWDKHLWTETETDKDLIISKGVTKPCQ